MKKFNNKYRINSVRLNEWDYGNPWWYYVTINTKEHKEYFGNVIKEKMILSSLGIAAENCWKEIPIHLPNIELDYFVIMPNHMHGIIIINPAVKTPDRALIDSNVYGRDVACNVSTYSKISPKKNSLSVIIR